MHVLSATGIAAGLLATVAIGLLATVAIGLLLGGLGLIELPGRFRRSHDLRRWTSAL